MRHLILTSALLLLSQATGSKAEIFPATDTVTGAAPINDFRREWYTKHLVAMAESRLPEGSGETYRFLWLRSFHNPVVVRVACVETKCQLTGIRTNGKGGYEPGRIVERKTRTLSANDVEHFQEMLTRARFWGPQVQQPDVIVNPDGTESLIVRSDGAEWVLEGRKNSTYHLWDLHGPEASGATAAYRELCLYLVQLSGLKVRQDEIY